jgi:hypothetical protein
LAGGLLWTETSLDLGRLETAAPITHTFYCRNPGKAPIRILRVDAPCGCILTSLGEDTIPAGGSGQVTVTFNTGGKSGPIDALLRIETDAGADSLRLHAEVENGISVEPPLLDFRKVFRGDTVSMTAIIHWERTEPATFDTATWGPQVRAIKIDRLVKGFAMRVWIAPKADKGAFTDTIRLVTGSPTWPFLLVPLRGEIGGRILPEPAFMDFGSISVKARNNATVTLRSLRRKPYTVTKIETRPAFLLASINRSQDRDWSAQGLIYQGAPVGPFEGWIKIYVNGSPEPEAVIPVLGTLTP